MIKHIGFDFGCRICPLKHSLRHLILPTKMVLLLILGACSSHGRVDGWYPVAEYPDNSIVGKPLATIKDFEKISILRDTFEYHGELVNQLLIQGRVKPEKRQQWADGTERLIGKRLGFVYNDSVITAPQINARIESASFQIISKDTALIKRLYDSINQELCDRNQ